MPAQFPAPAERGRVVNLATLRSGPVPHCGKDGPAAFRNAAQRHENKAIREDRVKQKRRENGAPARVSHSRKVMHADADATTCRGSLNSAARPANAADQGWIVIGVPSRTIA